MRRDAFTLIELLIVLGILVGIVGVAMLLLSFWFQRPIPDAESKSAATATDS